MFCDSGRFTYPNRQENVQNSTYGVFKRVAPQWFPCCWLRCCCWEACARWDNRAARALRLMLLRQIPRSSRRSPRLPHRQRRRSRRVPRRRAPNRRPIRIRAASNPFPMAQSRPRPRQSSATGRFAVHRADAKWFFSKCGSATTRDTGPKSKIWAVLAGKRQSFPRGAIESGGKRETITKQAQAGTGNSQGSGIPQPGSAATKGWL